MGHKAADWIAAAEQALTNRQLPEATAALHRAQTQGAPLAEIAGHAWQLAMLQGNFAQAWAVNDALRAANTPDPHRLWQGEPPAGRHLIIRCLHGLGDAVQMLRLIPHLHARTVTLQVPPPLVELARWLKGVDQVITWGPTAAPTPPPWDVQLEVMELPYILRLTLDDLPGPLRYLQLPVALQAATAKRMAATPRPRIGLVWSGGDWNPSRSMPLALLKHTLATADVAWWNLQGHRPVEPRPPWPPHDILDLGDGLPTLAACVASLDLVITTDTLAAHLAGALGRPVWLMLPFAADWRWLHNRPETPWYPTMRLFRQPTPGDWPTVANAIRQALDHWLVA